MRILNLVGIGYCFLMILELIKGKDFQNQMDKIEILSTCSERDVKVFFKLEGRLRNYDDKSDIIAMMFLFANFKFDRLLVFHWNLLSLFDSKCPLLFHCLDAPSLLFCTIDLQASKVRLIHCKCLSSRKKGGFHFPGISELKEDSYWPLG